MPTSTLLLPARFKKIGFIVFIPFAIAGIIAMATDLEFPFLEVHNASSKLFDNSNTNWSEEIILSGLIISLLLIAFSRQKNEDEFIQAIRLESLQWAVLVNYLLLFIANWTVYGFNFLNVMIYNMFTVLIIFIIRFHVVLRKYNSSIPE